MNQEKISFAQSGEDIIIDFIFDTLQVKTRSYLDIGAHHPTYLSNTYYFYKRGYTGVCIEPDPTLCSVIKEERPKDVSLAVGIGNKSNNTKFYIMDPPTLNTFSKKEAEMYQAYYPWTKIVKEIKIKQISINKILSKYFKKGLDILSVDTEGMDLEIIQSLDFNKYIPSVICVETAVYTGESSLTKNKELINYLLSKGYFIYADTFVNTIFVNKLIWKNNKGPKLEGFNVYGK